MTTQTENPKALMATIESIDKQVKSLRNEQKELLDTWVNIVCPHKVGDEVEVQGYSHTGKRCRILRVDAVSDWTGGRLWRVAAVVLKKDGTESKQQVQWNSNNEKQ